MRTAAFMMFCTLLILGAPVSGVSAETQSLPRSFEHAQLGMTFHDLTQTVPSLKVAQTGVELRHVVERPANRYLRRLDYDFVGDRLEQVTILYNADRLPRRGERMIELLKELYGAPTSESTDYRPEAGFLSEKKTTWQDQRTRVTLTQRLRFDDDAVLDVELQLVDLELEAIKQARLQEEERRRLAGIPIPRPDRGAVHTARQAAPERERAGRSS